MCVFKRFQEYKFAKYYYCADHRLKIGLATAAEVDQNLKEFFDLLRLLYNFFSGVNVVIIDVKRYRLITFRDLWGPAGYKITLR